MKTPSNIRKLFLTGSIAVLLATPAAHSATITWDANAAGAGITDSGNPWLGTGQWWNGSTNVDWTSGDDAVFGNGGTGGPVTLASPTIVNSLTVNSFTGTYTLGTTGQAITLANGITMNSGAGAVIIISPLTLSAAQSWTNNSTSLVTVGGTTATTLNLNGNALTIGGSGNTTFDGNIANIISGAGGIVKNGIGTLILDGGSSIPHTFSGGITINGGAVRFQSATNVSGRGNVTITGGYLGGRFNSGPTYAGGLGTGATAIQITGGTSGFSGEGATGSTFTIGAAASVLKWGASGENGATGFFNPAVLILGGDQGMNTNAKGSLNNGIDLNGTDRTITSLHANGDGAATTGFAVSGTIVNTAGTTAGFTKTGPGNVILSNTGNTYNGATTITGGSITAAGSGSLGNGSATNTLVFDGGSLIASGVIASPATRAVTVNSTAVINSNTFAVSFAGNLSGAGGLTKNGTGALTLSGTNSYGGLTIVNAGSLAIGTQASLYNGVSASWTAANINVKAGAGLTVNVDSAGTAGFDATALNTLLGNISVANTAAQGMQAGATLGIDTTTASGTTFTQGNAITNSTGAFGGVISLSKLGAGTLVVDKANTYTGITTIGAGTFQLNEGGAISTVLLNNGTFAVNRSSASSLGAGIPAVIAGTGALSNIGSGVITLNAPTGHTGTTTATTGGITLSHALAIQHSALGTTGAGPVILSGVTAPVFGGLSGATGDLATVISTGYSGVTNLTLKPVTGSVTYGGIIANGAAGMTLTKNGAGTQTLGGASTYTGATNLNAGTLQLDPSGRLVNSAINFNGGNLTLLYSGVTDADRVSTATVTSKGGTWTQQFTTAGPFSETIGTVELAAGQLNFVSSGSPSSGSSPLIIGAINRTGLTSTLSVTPSANGIYKVTGATATSANQIIGPWATHGTASNVQTKWAVYNGSETLVADAIADTAFASWANSTTDAWSYNTGTSDTINATKQAAAVRYYGAGSTLTLGTGNLETNGLMFTGTNAKIVASTGGALTTPSGGGNLFLSSGNTGTSTISAPINDNSGAVTIVVGNAVGRTLIVGSTAAVTASNYSGGTVLNSGILQVNGPASTDSNNVLGAATGGITFNGGQLNIASTNIGAANSPTSGTARIVTVNEAGGALQVNKNNFFNTTGKLTGAGPLTLLNAGGSGTIGAYNFNSTANDFTGALILRSGTTFMANSFTDSANNIIVSATNADATTFIYGANATAPLSLTNRAFEINAAANVTSLTIQNNNTTNAVTVNSNLIATGSGAKTLTFGSVAGPLNVFAGAISNGFDGGIVGIGKTGSGKWALSGTNTFSGTIALTNANPAGPLIFQGIQAFPTAVTSVTMNDNSSNQTLLKILDDGAGIIDRTGANITFTSNQSSAAGVTNFFVGNNNTANDGNNAGSTQTGSTVALGTFTSTPTNLGSTGDNINITGANGYRLQIAGIRFPNISTKAAASTFTVTLNPTTASATIAGNVVPFASTNANSAPVLSLGGTAAGNLVTGGILDPSNVGTASALRLSKSGASNWTISGSNTYSGATTISGGTLIGIGANAFGSTTGISIAAASSATLSLRGDSSTSFVKASDSSAIPVTTTASGASINVDQATVAGTAAKTMTIGALTLNTAITNGTTITGANNTSLATGAVATGNSASGTETITNNISGGGKLTLASVAVNRTGAPTLAFAGNGDTIVSGAITEVAPTTLTKNGTGTLTLAGTELYTGPTTVLNGTLLVSGSISGSATTVNPGATLGGSGTVGTVSVSGTLAPGSSIESLAMGSLTMNSGSTFAYELNNDAAPGVAGDLAAIAGGFNLAIDNTTAITFTELGSGSWLAGEKLTIASYGGAWNGGFFDFGGSSVTDDSLITIGGTQWTFDYNDTIAGTNFAADLTGPSYVTITAVPEPGAAMSLLAGLGVLTLVRRRRV